MSKCQQSLSRPFNFLQTPFTYLGTPNETIHARISILVKCIGKGWRFPFYFPLYYSERPALSTDCWQAFLERFCFSVYMHAFSDTHMQTAQSLQRQRLDVVRCCSEKLCCRLRSSRSRKRYQRHNENVSSSSEVRHEGLTSSESQADFCVHISLCAGVK